MAPVIHLGQSLSYKNQSLWLRLDSDDISGLDENLEPEDSFVIRKRFGDALVVLPALERFRNKMPGSSWQAANENMEKICRNREKFFEFIAYHQAYKYPFVPDMDLDAALYQDGFFSTQEKKQSDLFHKALKDLKSGYQKQKILKEIKSPRIKKLAGRILARNFEDKAEQTKETEWHLHLDRLRSSLEKDRIVGYKNDIKFNRQQGLKELKEVENEILDLDQDQLNILNWLKDYIENL